MFDVETFAKSVTILFKNCYNFFEVIIAVKKSYVGQIGHSGWPVSATCFNFCNWLIFSKVGYKVQMELS